MNNDKPWWAWENSSTYEKIYKVICWPCKHSQDYYTIPLIGWLSVIIFVLMLFPGLWIELVAG